jgi:hypothetical protein
MGSHGCILYECQMEKCLTRYTIVVSYRIRLQCAQDCIHSEPLRITDMSGSPSPTASQNPINSTEACVHAYVVSTYICM